MHKNSRRIVLLRSTHKSELVHSTSMCTLRRLARVHINSNGPFEHFSLGGLFSKPHKTWPTFEKWAQCQRTQQRVKSHPFIKKTASFLGNAISPTSSSSIKQQAEAGQSVQSTLATAQCLRSTRCMWLLVRYDCALKRASPLNSVEKFSRSWAVSTHLSRETRNLLCSGIISGKDACLMNKNGCNERNSMSCCVPFQKKNLSLSGRRFICSRM